MLLTCRQGAPWIGFPSYGMYRLASRQCSLTGICLHTENDRGDQQLQHSGTLPLSLILYRRSSDRNSGCGTSSSAKHCAVFAHLMMAFACYDLFL